MKNNKHKILKIMPIIIMLIFMFSASYAAESEPPANAGDTGCEQIQQTAANESELEEFRSELGAIERKIYTIAVILCIINLAVTMFIFSRLRKRDSD